MSSARLPGKILMPVKGKPILGYLVDSLRRSSQLRDIVLATSKDRSDDPVEMFCRKEDIRCIRGPLEDVAGRFLETIDEFGIDDFVRVNGDSPLLDYHLVDRAVELFTAGENEIVTNTLKRSFPKGQSVEVVNASAFRKAYGLMKDDADHEHVTRYFYMHPGDFRICNFSAKKDYSGVQLSVDSPDDMRKFKILISAMTRSHWEYRYEELVDMISSIDN